MTISAMSKLKFDDKLKAMGVTDKNVEKFKDKYFISISHASVFEDEDVADGEWVPMFRENKSNVLVLLFDDVISEEFNHIPGTKVFSEEQAVEVINFLERINPEQTSELIIHCAMGSSRSVAIGEFAAEMFGQRPDFITARIDRKANPLVARKLREAKSQRPF